MRERIGIYKEITGKEAKRDMEYFMRLLKKEWERSGKTTAVITISLTETAEVNRRFVSVIKMNTEQMEEKETEFKESLILSKTNYILLRLIKKVKKAEEKANKKSMDDVITVELDKEEYRIFTEIMGK